MLCILHIIKYHGSCLIYLAFSFPVKKRTGKNRVEQLKLHPLSTIAKVRMQWCLLLISRVHLSDRWLPESPGTVILLCICRYDVSHIYIYIYYVQYIAGTVHCASWPNDALPLSSTPRQVSCPGAFHKSFTLIHPKKNRFPRQLRLLRPWFPKRYTSTVVTTSWKELPMPHHPSHPWPGCQRTFFPCQPFQPQVCMGSVSQPCIHPCTSYDTT